MTKSAWLITFLCVAVLAVGTLVVLQAEPPVKADGHGAEGAGHDDHGAETSDAGHGDHGHGADASGHDDHGADGSEGPRGGRLLTLAAGRVEVTVFETNTPPEFRIYVGDKDGNAVSTDPALWRIVLTRSDRADTFTFRSAAGYLQSREEIAEPHEFQVSLRGSIGGIPIDTNYFQEEAHGHGGSAASGGTGKSLGVVRMTREVMRNNAITLVSAAPGQIFDEIQLPGEVAVNADRVSHVVPRFAGIVQKVFKKLGDHVESGEVLAVVQSNESVAPYEIKSLLEGNVIERHMTLGEYVRDDAPVFVVADLSTVWVHISVYPKYLALVRPGVRVRLQTTGGTNTEGTIDYVGPIVGERTRTAQARVVLDNSKGQWQPGLFVTARLAMDAASVGIVVPDEAIQTVEGQSAVFVLRDNGFEARVVVLGRTDGSWVEVLAGLTAGEEIAATNTFLIKAEFGKSEAGHDH